MYAADIKKLTKENTNFRKVLHTGEHSQIVAMCLALGEEIGIETHHTADQMLFLVDGKAKVVVGNETVDAEEHDVVFIPAGSAHNVTNSGDKALKLFTVYAPATHADGTIHPTKADAMSDEATEKSFDGPQFATFNYNGQWLSVPHHALPL